MYPVYCVIGMFSYYSRWIVSHYEKITLLVQVKPFPQLEMAEKALQCLKSEMENAEVNSIKVTILFVMEMYTFDQTTTVTLNQSGRPFVFFSRV